MIQGHFWELGQVADERLLESVRRLVRADRRVSARLLAHLTEVEERRLHLAHAKPSMFEYCIELGMSEDEAGRRLCAAGVAKRFPEVYRMLDEGRLSLSVICKLKHYLTEANRRELLTGVASMSYRRAEAWLAAKFPKPDAPSTVRKLPQRLSSAGAPPGGVEAAAPVEMMTPETAPPKQAAKADASSTLTAATDRFEPQAATGGREEARARPNTSNVARPLDRGRVEPLAADRYRVQFTGSSKLKDKLELAADLMAHRNPSRDFAPIVERALDLLIAKLENERFGKTSRPRPGRTAKPDRVTRETQRAVLERDGLRCSYVDEHGRRCTGRAFLERDHKNPRGKGGGPKPENVRHLCRQHNQWLAEVEYGRHHMDRARSANRRRNTTGRPATSRASPRTNPTDAASAEVPEGETSDPIPLALAATDVTERDARRDA